MSFQQKQALVYLLELRRRWIFKKEMFHPEELCKKGIVLIQGFCSVDNLFQTWGMVVFMKSNTA